MITHEVEDEVTHLVLHSSHDTDFYCVKPDGTKYLLQIRKDTPEKITQISEVNANLG